MLHRLDFPIVVILLTLIFLLLEGLIINDLYLETVYLSGVSLVLLLKAALRFLRGNWVYWISGIVNLMLIAIVMYNFYVLRILLFGFLFSTGHIPWTWFLGSAFSLFILVICLWDFGALIRSHKSS